VVFVLWVKEGIAVSLKGELMYLHTAAISANDWLRHEGSMSAVFEGDLLDDQAIK